MCSFTSATVHVYVRVNRMDHSHHSKTGNLLPPLPTLDSLGFCIVMSLTVNCPSLSLIVPHCQLEQPLHWDLQQMWSNAPLTVWSMKTLHGQDQNTEILHQVLSQIISVSSALFLSGGLINRLLLPSKSTRTTMTTALPML